MRKIPPLVIRWTNDKIKILGFHFGNVDVSKDNWEPTIAKIKSLLNIWCIRKLTFHVKVTGIKFTGYQRYLVFINFNSIT